MKQVKIKLPLRALTLASGLLLTVSSFAQTNAVKGHVKDENGILSRNDNNLSQEEKKK